MRPCTRLARRPVLTSMLLRPHPVPHRGLAPPSTSRAVPAPGRPLLSRNRRCSRMHSTPPPLSQTERFVAELSAAGGADGTLNGQLGALVAQVRERRA